MALGAVSTLTLCMSNTSKYMILESEGMGALDTDASTEDNVTVGIMFTSSTNSTRNGIYYAPRRVSLSGRPAGVQRSILLHRHPLLPLNIHFAHECTTSQECLYPFKLPFGNRQELTNG
jgi:hypothetical protein